MPPERWSERLLSFALSVMVAVLVLRWAAVAIQPLLPVLVIAIVIYGYLSWQYRR